MGALGVFLNYMGLNYSAIKKEYEQISEKLSQTTDSQELAKLGKRQRELLPMVTDIEKLENVEREILEHEKMIADKSELAEVAATELPALKSEQEKLLEQLKIAMLPKDPMMRKILLLKLERELMVTSLACLLQNYFVCTPNTQKSLDTKFTFLPRIAHPLAATKK